MACIVRRAGQHRPHSFLRKCRWRSATAPIHWHRITGTNPCQVTGNLVTTGDDYDAYRYSLERTVRKELERSWRVFTRHPEAGFRAISDTDEALRLLAVLETQQSTRMHDIGATYVLNEETSAAFYRNLIVTGLCDGFVSADGADLRRRDCRHAAGGQERPALHHDPDQQCRREMVETAHRAG